MSEHLGRAAYAAFGESLNWRTPEGDSLPQFSQLAEPTRKAWEAAMREGLKEWLSVDFRMALRDVGRVDRDFYPAFVSALKENPDDKHRIAVCALVSFVMPLIDPKCIEREKLERNAH